MERIGEERTDDWRPRLVARGNMLGARVKARDGQREGIPTRARSPSGGMDVTKGKALRHTERIGERIGVRS